jgi:hypothetical protein
MTMTNTVEVWAIMVLLDGTWYPYRPFTKADKKTERRARKALTRLRGKHRIWKPQFRLEKIRMQTEESNEV